MFHSIKNSITSPSPFFTRRVYIRWYSYEKGWKMFRSPRKWLGRLFRQSCYFDEFMSLFILLKGEEFALQKNISVDFPLWYFACCSSLSISYIIRLVVWSRIFLRLSHLFKLSFPLTCLELSLFHHSLSTLFSDTTTVISFTQIKYTIPFTYGLHWV